MFENTTMLAGLGGAAVPAVIHLLGRARYRSVDWGAMMFIASGGPRWRDGARLREWALLGIRMAAVGLLAVALARPVAGVAAGGGGGGGETAHVSAVVIVDSSASMAYEDVGGSRIERAKAAALQVLSTLRRGDRACLIAAGAGQNPTPPQLSSDLQSVAARVSELKPTPGAADLAAALTAAATLFERQQDRAARQLFLVCDRQAASWRNVDDAFLAAWGSAPSGSRAGLAKFVVIPVGGAETDNVSIESVALLNPPAVRGCAAQVKVKVRNHGPTPRLGLPLTLRFAGSSRDVIATATVNLAGGAGDSVIVPVSFPARGPEVLSAELSGGGPNLDDRRDCVVDVSPPLHALVVCDDVAGAASPLRAALAPYAAAGRAGADLADVRLVTGDDWDESDLGGYDLIVLDDVASPTASQAAALEQFVYAGGGLLVAPGPASRTERYNQVMYHEEGGLLPALLQPATAAATTAAPAASAIDPASIDASHPMLRFMSGRGGDPLDARIDRYLPVTARTPSAHVTAAYTSGDAFLVDSPYGRGRVLLVTCGLGEHWSSLPLTSFYLPLVQSAARYLAGANVPERNVSSGAELVAVFEPPVPAGVRRGTVTRPDGTRDTCGVSTIDQRSEARYARTDLPGLYTIQFGPRPGGGGGGGGGAAGGGGGAGGGERRAIFSVAPPAIESDLTPLAETDWKRLQRSLGFARMETGEKPLAARLAAARGGAAGSEYWLAAMAGVMALLVIELALTRAWSAEKDKVTR